MNLADMQNWYYFETEMNASNSTLHKREVLLKWKDNTFIQWILRQTYDPFVQYYVSKKALDKLKHADPTKVNPDVLHNRILLPELLTLLATRKITGHEALHSTKFFIDNCGYGDIILKLLNRDSELRAGTTLINEAIPGLIPKFECQLAEKYDSKRVDLNDIWYASRKLDGVRCLIVINELGAITFFSRSGKEFTTLDKIRQELLPLNLKSIVFDGEICIVDENGVENFNGVMSEVTRKDFTMENPKFVCFDLITLKEFSDRIGQSDRQYSVRYKEMQNFFETNKFNCLELLEHVVLNTEADREIMAARSVEQKWEGYMMNKDVPYKGKRSYDLLKGKIMLDCECRITGYEMGEIRVIVNGLEVSEEMLSAIKIDFNGHEVRVGSGFSLEDRRKFYQDPLVLIDRQATVQYFEETTNKQGTISLRFPVIKHIFLEGDRDL